MRSALLALRFTGAFLESGISEKIDRHNEAKVVV
jgi:hypothetical protein